MTTLNTTQIDLIAALVNVALSRYEYVDHADELASIARQTERAINFAADVLRVSHMVKADEMLEAREVYLRCAGHRNAQAAKLSGFARQRASWQV